MSKINKIRLSGTDYDIQDVSATSVVEVTQQQYDDLPASAKTDNILYIITDSTVDYVTSAQTQSAITQAVSGKVDTSTYTAYTAATDTALANKQTTLTAGTGIAITNNVISTTGGGNSVVELTQAAYDALVTGGTVDPDTFYIITDATPADMSQYWTSAQTQSAITQAVSGKVDTTTYNTYTAATDTALNGKQDTLVSSQNIKTINNESILGSGNINIQGGGSSYTAGDGIDITNNVISVTGKVDTSAITTSVSSSSTDAQVPSAKAVYDELVINGGTTETTLTFNDYYSTNYPSGCTEVKVTAPNWEYVTVYFLDANDSRHGYVEIDRMDGESININVLFDGASYSIDNNEVVISYPSVTDVSKVQLDNGNTTVKAVVTQTIHLKDQVTANTTALGGLSLVKLTQAEYNALSPNYDSNTLYVING